MAGVTRFTETLLEAVESEMTVRASFEYPETSLNSSLPS